MHRTWSLVLTMILLGPALLLRAQPASQPSADSDALFQQATEFAEAEKWDEALTVMRRLVAQEPENARAQSVCGSILMQLHRDAEAVEFLARASKLNPENPVPLANLGQAYQKLNKPAESAQAYEALVKMNPDDWRAHAKLVQNYQAMGRVEDRDRERAVLFDLRKAKTVDQKLFCREQFNVGADRVMAMEYFELAGEFAVRYSFHVLDAAGETKYRVSLGSYDSTNEVARQTGETKEGERLFHLDGYYPGDEHRTFGFFQQEPTYEQTREMVVKVVNGDAKVLSGSKPTTQGVEIRVEQGR